ncbi:MAG TPA: hybrid sensor histidine kinase/response regulator [Gammaproteobacteria bacterium]|nr:hybrid sensor histidine kinase/response regulator [Gammaproteobacteria bacterium]
MMETVTLSAALVTANTADAGLALELLEQAGIRMRAYESIGALCKSIPQDIGCIVIGGDALTEDELPLLRTMIENQPAWSDIPLILIGPDSVGLGMLVERILPNSGNLTLLEQPLNQATLISAVRVALRARARQLEVRDLLAQRDEALRMRDEFLAMLAHELRNPLAPMRNAVYLQQRLNIDDPAFTKTRGIFDRQVTHMSRMVDDLLDVARLERGKLQLQRKHVDLNALVTAAVDTSLPAIQAGNHRVKINLARQPLLLNADPVRIEQLVINLITNAAKFTLNPGEITLETRQEGAAGVVSVRDTGIGLTPEMVNAVFQPFTQDDRSLARSRGGLGIGLTIARRLAELHGGSLLASSEGPDKGSIFTARFPLASAAAVEIEQPASAQDSLRPRRIVIVEDNADIRESLRMILEVWGHEVASADTGQRGLELVRRVNPHVALIDIGLPGMTGYEVARTIRTAIAAESPQIKLIAITGYGQPGDRERTLQAGFDTHLLKPIDPQVLHNILSI